MRAVVCFVLGLSAFAIPAIARPPPGENLSSEAHRWWECINRNGLSCCAQRDGHALDDAHWRQTLRPDGTVVYEVLVEGVWFDVPPVLVVTSGACGRDPDPRTATMAKLWFTPYRMGGRLVGIDIVCFMAGTQY